MNNSIRISCDVDNLQRVRDFVRDFLSAYALNEQVKEDIVLAVDEISANLIIHANKKDSSKFIELTISSKRSNLLFEFTDQGVSYNPAKYLPPNVEEKIRDGIKGGLGMFLVHHIMDKVEFVSNNGTNYSRLYKNLANSIKSNQVLY
ncbi:ATP-binding protein [Adhaeribacter radiodurans]|uniref:ATP-binding protein n=1 Tax=Adhaeribacter radiodurans TaxID=2745197 RepID=A0A7L7L4J1_9BACT|nr:ATP-binding protein [Adhaeribacter radiodurans]QMU27299.1 ATP-binding protein [Adhaeribacter radiodurans]